MLPTVRMYGEHGGEFWPNEPRRCLTRNLGQTNPTDANANFGRTNPSLKP